MKPFILAVVVLAGLAAACSPSDFAWTPAKSWATPPRQHVVAQGETFEQIASRYGIDTGALLAANGLQPNAPLNLGQPLVIPAAQAPAALPGTGATTDVVASTESEPTASPPRPLSKAWRDAQLERAKALIEDMRAREGGIFFLGGAALVAGFLALQVLIWFVRELVLTFAPLVRKLGAIGHDFGLNVWYAAWWIGLMFWVPARAVWRVMRPVVAPRALALGRFALAHGTEWSHRGARWAQARGRRAAIAVRDEAIDALEELALRRPSLRGVSEKVQALAYKESRAMRSRLPFARAEAWPPSEQELLDALEDGSLSVQFSPMLDMTAVTVAALESSFNWDRPGSGAIPATRLGMAVERPGYTRIQRALLEHALRQACERLQDEPRDDAHPVVVVPLGRAQFFDPTLFVALRTVLQEWSIAPNQLELGIDERAVLSDLVAAGEVLARLREVGVLTNLRGFGALTLQQLQALPVSAVTVDFWNSRHDERIEAYVAESVRTARAAGLPVTASRAETTDEVQFARSLGCERLTSVPAGHSFVAALALVPVDDSETRAAA